MHPSASSFVEFGVGGLAATMVAVLLFGVWRSLPERGTTLTAGILLWVAGAAALGASGVLTHFEARPPPLLLIVVGTIAFGLFIGLGTVGASFARKLPLWALVGSQGFRLPLELVMHRAASEGTMPVEMSFSGYNFDIVTGVSALVVAVALAKGAPAWVAFVWNVVGSGLLAVVVTVALLGTPMIHAFGTGAHLNTWIAYFPFVWLPTVLVALALGGHIVVFRALSAR